MYLNLKNVRGLTPTKIPISEVYINLDPKTGDTYLGVVVQNDIFNFVVINEGTALINGIFKSEFLNELEKACFNEINRSFGSFWTKIEKESLKNLFDTISFTVKYASGHLIDER